MTEMVKSGSMSGERKRVCSPQLRYRAAPQLYFETSESVRVFVRA
jgi:hypothetical protein